MFQTVAFKRSRAPTTSQLNFSAPARRGCPLVARFGFVFLFSFLFRLSFSYTFSMSSCVPIYSDVKYLYNFGCSICCYYTALLNANVIDIIFKSWHTTPRAVTTTATPYERHKPLSLAHSPKCKYIYFKIGKLKFSCVFPKFPLMYEYIENDEQIKKGARAGRFAFI